MLTTATLFLDKALFVAKIRSLEKVKALLEKKSLENKVEYLKSYPKIKRFFVKKPFYKQLLKDLSLEHQLIFLSLVMIDQSEHVCPFADEVVITHIENLKKLLSSLKPVECFFASEGGIIGYQLIALRLLKERMEEGGNLEEGVEYEPPALIDITKDTFFINRMKVSGIDALKDMAEVYPIGGAADRLRLQDDVTLEDLPAARLEFLGHTLIEGMIRDLQAREYLYYKLRGERVITPIALMTSLEKDNHALIQKIFKEHGFFRRPVDSFCFFIQPLVPVFTHEGDWCLKQPWQILMKPGGHGAIWKMCLEERVFEWFKSKGRSKALVRQINNPIAGVDHGLLTLVGVGHAYNKSLGFASCPREVQSHEGMNVVKRETREDAHVVTLTNIEYCDFKKCGVEDKPQKLGGKYSQFPSNTNIIFVDLEAIKQALNRVPFPGMLINFKSMKHWRCGDKDQASDLARVELLMQNIADAFSKHHSVEEGKLSAFDLPSFITFNARHKTISTTKKQFIPGSGLVETAVGCYYDYLRNGWELLTRYCSFDMPAFPDEEEFLQKGPSFIFKYHPALGPLYEVIGYKMRKGKMGHLSELQLEIADIDISNLSIDGSMMITASNIMGHVDDRGQLIYSHQTGRCMLDNVTVVNQGIDKDKEHIFWKNKIFRKETFHVHLEGFSEFCARDVSFEGPFYLHVPDGKKAIVTAASHGGIIVTWEDLAKDQDPFWKCHIDDSSKISFSK